MEPKLQSSEKKNRENKCNGEKPQEPRGLATGRSVLWGHRKCQEQAWLLGSWPTNLCMLLKLLCLSLLICEGGTTIHFVDGCVRELSCEWKVLGTGSH